MTPVVLDVRGVPDLPYVFVYRATAAHIHILHVFHTSMNC